MDTIAPLRAKDYCQDHQRIAMVTRVSSYGHIRAALTVDRPQPGQKRSFANP